MVTPNGIWFSMNVLLFPGLAVWKNKTKQKCAMTNVILSLLGSLNKSLVYNAIFIFFTVSDGKLLSSESVLVTDQWQLSIDKSQFCQQKHWLGRGNLSAMSVGWHLKQSHLQGHGFVFRFRNMRGYKSLKNVVTIRDKIYSRSV